MKKTFFGMAPVLISGILLSGCGTLFKRSAENEVVTTVVQKEEVPVQLEPRHIGDPLSELDIELLNKMGSVPADSQKHVRKWLNYFQGRGKKYMEKYLMRSTRYIPLMKQILREEGVPEDLVYIALIESGFNPKAYSPAAAVGYWQFIRPTGKHYNLKITNLVDERRDVVASTRAAANYFKSLYNLFGSWYLSMASYNTGENRVKRAVMKYQTRDFWDIAQRRRLPRETRNYVPKFLAAILIGHYPGRFGFKNIDYQEEISFDTIHISHGISLKKLAEKINVPHEEMMRLNPALLSDYAPYYKDSFGYIRVPKGLGEQAISVLAEVKSSPPAYVADNGFVYRVRRGDTLSTIARRFRTTQRSIKYNNGIGRRSLIRVGQKLKIPNRQIRIRAERETAVADQSGSTDSEGYYKVRRGDSLIAIAKRFGTTVSKLKTLNGLGRRNLIKVGMVLKVKEDSKNSSAVSRPRTIARSKTIYHKVRSGENLSLIANKYNTTVGQLRQLNELRRRGFLSVGQKLVVRKSSGVHIVRKGETLSDIAEKYQVSLNNIKEANTIENASTIYAGTKIFIPHSNN